MEGSLKKKKKKKKPNAVPDEAHSNPLPNLTKRSRNESNQLKLMTEKPSALEERRPKVVRCVTLETDPFVKNRKARHFRTTGRTDQWRRIGPFGSCGSRPRPTGRFE